MISFYEDLDNAEGKVLRDSSPYCQPYNITEKQTWKAPANKRRAGESGFVTPPKNEINFRLAV